MIEKFMVSDYILGLKKGLSDNRPGLQ